MHNWKPGNLCPHFAITTELVLNVFVETEILITKLLFSSSPVFDSKCPSLIPIPTM